MKGRLKKEAFIVTAVWCGMQNIRNGFDRIKGYFDFQLISLQEFYAPSLLWPSFRLAHRLLVRAAG